MKGGLFKCHYVIHDSMCELFDQTDTPLPVLTPTELKAFLEKNVRIVVIETNAGLSKTIQIFNVINTTGLDLSGADIFKVRLFEFLTTKRDASQDVFDEISGLYGDIKRCNESTGYCISMPRILAIMQSIIIAKYDLSNVLFEYSTDRFFDQLFDGLLGVNLWRRFAQTKLEEIRNDDSSDSPLSIEGIRKLIKHVYAFEKRFNSKTESALRDIAMNELMWLSRYGRRYWQSPVIYMYHLGDEGLSEFYNGLVRTCLCYSLICARTVREARSCVQQSLKAIFAADGKPPSMILKNWRVFVEDKTRNAIRDKELAWNRAWKNIACRLSEYLEHSEAFEKPNPELLEALFHERVDIEHIQSYHDEDGKRRDDIWKQWGGKLNGIGNLAMLEYNINRSISNKSFSKKIDGYKKSKYRNIQKLADEPKWGLDECEARRDAETEKLMNWLFQPA